MATDDAAHRLPPLADEDHRCAACELAYTDISIAQAAGFIATVPAATRRLLDDIPASAHRSRPGGGSWSVAEYVCHLRDVYACYTMRLHRCRTEAEPALEPMLNDLRARRFRYRSADLDAMVAELAAHVAGFGEEIDRVGADQWTRTVTRLPGERRTATWLVRQAMHEGVHHLADIRHTAARVATTADPSDG